MAHPDFTRLPDPVRFEDLVAEVDVRPVPDPEAGQNTDQRITLQYAGG